MTEYTTLGEASRSTPSTTGRLFLSAFLLLTVLTFVYFDLTTYLSLDAIKTHRDKMAAEARNPREVGIASLRGGDVIGEHTAYFVSDVERLEFTHRATSRSVFAQGAWRAALWVAGQPAGRYGMRNVLGL